MDTVKEVEGKRKETEVEEGTSAEVNKSLAEDVAEMRKILENLQSVCERVAQQCQDEPTARELRGVINGAASHSERLLKRVCHSSGSSSDTCQAFAHTPNVHDVVAIAERYSVEQRAIGVVRSPYRELNGTPRQAMLAADVPGEIELFGSVQPQYALTGLEQYSHVWIVGMFHGNTNVTYHPLVAPPLMEGARTGVFGSRSPHRPNAIALSLCRVESVDKTKGVVRVRGIDLVDGTPVLDLKPYVPADIVPDARCPQWIHSKRIEHVTWTPEALAQLNEIYAESETPKSVDGQATDEKTQTAGTGKKKTAKKARKRLRREERLNGKRIVKTAEEAKHVVEQMLLLDVRSVHAKAKHTLKEYGVTLDDVGFIYSVDDETRSSTVFAVNRYDPLLKAISPPPRTVPWPKDAPKPEGDQVVKKDD